MRHAALIVTLFLLVACSLPLVAQTVSEPPHAILLPGITLAPVQAVAASVGATVTAEGTKLTLTRDAQALTMTGYATAATGNSQALTLPAPPLLRGDHWYVPARAVAEFFGATIALQLGTAQDSAQRISITNQGKTTLFRVVEAGRIVQADLTGSGLATTAFAVANVPDIDQYNSPYLTDIVRLEAWVVREGRELWRSPSLATGVSITDFLARDMTGDRIPELQLTYFTRHSYMGPYPGSVSHMNVFRWNSATFATAFSQDYSRDHGHLAIDQPSPTKPARIILYDTNWRRNEDVTHYIAELYTWNATRFVRSKRVLTRRPITSLATARRLLGI